VLERVLDLAQRPQPPIRHKLPRPFSPDAAARAVHAAWRERSGREQHHCLVGRPQVVDDRLRRAGSQHNRCARGSTAPLLGRRHVRRQQICGRVLWEHPQAEGRQPEHQGRGDDARPGRHGSADPEPRLRRRQLGLRRRRGGRPRALRERVRRGQRCRGRVPVPVLVPQPDLQA
ncbi:unnamed protein product, partial [Prorocentrum cordatum]